MRPLPEAHQLAEPDLVQDLSWLLVPEVVERLALPGGQDAQGRLGQLGGEGKRLIGRDEAVAAEQGHEPRQAGRGNRRLGDDLGIEAQGREVHQAAPVDVPQLVPARLERRRLGHPFLQAEAHVRDGMGERAVPVLVPDLALGLGHDVHAGLPLPVGRDLDLERQPALLGLGLVGGDEGLAHEVLSPIAQHEAAVADLAVQLALLLQRVLHLEDVREIGVRGEVQANPDGLGRVVQHDQVLVDAVADRALANHRELGVLVDRPRGRVEEELRREVIDVVRGQHLERTPLDRQDPSRQESGVAMEQPVGLIGPGVDVSPPVTDDEGASIQDADRVARHRNPPAWTRFSAQSLDETPLNRAPSAQGSISAARAGPPSPSRIFRGVQMNV